MVGTTSSHYKIIEKIGQGGMGEVVRAEDTILDREAAIKVLPEQFTSEPQQLARFEREAKLLAHLESEPLHIDEIRRRAGLPITQVSGLLTMLEIKRRVKQVGCMHYVMIREATPIYGS